MSEEEVIVISVSKSIFAVVLFFILIISTLFFLSSAEYCDYRMQQAGIRVRDMFSSSHTHENLSWSDAYVYQREK